MSRRTATHGLETRATMKGLTPAEYFQMPPTTTAAKPTSTTSDSLDARARKAQEQLDAHVREMIQWHFSPETGSPFWLEKAQGWSFDPRKEVKAFADLRKLPHFEDDWL